jgi:hypothetical protein
MMLNLAEGIFLFLFLVAKSASFLAEDGKKNKRQKITLPIFKN